MNIQRFQIYDIAFAEIQKSIYCIILASSFILVFTGFGVLQLFHFADERVILLSISIDFNFLRKFNFASSWKIATFAKLKCTQK